MLPRLSVVKVLTALALVLAILAVTRPSQAMGLWNTFVTTSLRQTGPDHYEVVSAC